MGIKACYIIALGTCLPALAQTSSGLPLGIYGHARSDYFPQAAKVHIVCLYNGTSQDVTAQLNANHDFYIPAAYFVGITSGECAANYLTSTGANEGNDGSYFAYNQSQPATPDTGLSPFALGAIGRVVTTSTGVGIAGLTVEIDASFGIVFTTTDSQGYFLSLLYAGDPHPQQPGTSLVLRNPQSSQYNLYIYNSGHSIFIGPNTFYWSGSPTSYYGLGLFKAPNT